MPNLGPQLGKDKILGPEIENNIGLCQHLRAPGCPAFSSMAETAPFTDIEERSCLCMEFYEGTLLEAGGLEQDCCPFSRSMPFLFVSFTPIQPGCGAFQQGVQSLGV